MRESAILDFIKEIFDGYDINFSQESKCSYYNDKRTYVIHIEAKDLKIKDMINSILEDCILLNTYLKKYFKRLDVIDNYDIVYNVYCLHNLSEIENFKENKIQFYTSQNTIHINELVRINSEANKMHIDYQRDSYAYDSTIQNYQKI